MFHLFWYNATFSKIDREGLLKDIAPKASSTSWVSLFKALDLSETLDCHPLNGIILIIEIPIMLLLHDCFEDFTEILASKSWTQFLALYKLGKSKTQFVALITLTRKCGEKKAMHIENCCMYLLFIVAVSICLWSKLVIYLSSCTRNNLMWSI